MDILRLNELHSAKKCGACIDFGTKKCEYHNDEASHLQCESHEGVR